jgi:hypothetical protein
MAARRDHWGVVDKPACPPALGCSVLSPEDKSPLFVYPENYFRFAFQNTTNKSLPFNDSRCRSTTLHRCTDFDFANVVASLACNEDYCLQTNVMACNEPSFDQ